MLACLDTYKFYIWDTDDVTSLFFYFVYFMSFSALDIFWCASQVTCVWGCKGESFSKVG